jgi:hypothetical protein
VLGCGHLLAAHPGATVLTVFAGAPDRYPDPMTRWDNSRGSRRATTPSPPAAALAAPEQHWRLAPPPAGWEGPAEA